MFSIICNETHIKILNKKKEIILKVKDTTFSEGSDNMI